MKPQTNRLIPTYHLMSAEGSSYVYSTTVAQFREQIAILPLTSRDIPQVTFDDGHASHYRYAFPMLQEANVSATFFVVVGWIDRRRDYMSWSNLRELLEAGLQVQSHGLNHQFLTRCDDKILLEEVEQSKNKLEQKLGCAVSAISIPYGRYNEKVISACATAGYSTVYTSDPFPLRIHRSGLQLLGRYMVHRSTTLQELQCSLAPGRGALRRMRVHQGCKRLARLALGEQTYHALWGLLGSRKALHAAAEEY